MLESHSPILVPIAFAIGLFYVAGGFLHMRVLVLDAMADQLLSMLGDSEAGTERLRTSFMAAGAALTFASGLSLLALSRWTPVIFACNLLLQGAYLIWAQRAFPPQDASEHAGRRSTIRAFLFYLAAFAFVLSLGRLEAWRAWLEPAIAELAVIVALTGALGWFLRHRPQQASKVPSAVHLSVPDPTSADPAQARPPPEHLRLWPTYHCSPLWDHERGNMENPADLGLSDTLVERILAWDATFQATWREDDPDGSGFENARDERAWVKEGDAIAAELKHEWRGPLSLQISALTDLLEETRHNLNPYDRIPGDRVRWIGERCGVAEIEAAIERLDALSLERDALPKWDGDTQDDIAMAQELFQAILAKVPSRYIEDVAAGLDSAQWGTRSYVALALAEHDRDAALPFLRQALAREDNELVRSMLATAIERLENTGEASVGKE